MSSQSATEEIPEWVPDEYDPDASLRERLPAIDNIEGGVDLYVGDDRGVVKVVGTPKQFRENGVGVQTLKAGGGLNDIHTWSWEIVVPTPEHGDPVLKSVDPNQPEEIYSKTKSTELREIDVRIYGVDHERLEGVEGGE